MKVGEAKKQKWVVDIVSILQSETTCQTNRASCVYCLMQGGRAHATVHALQSISAGLKGAGYRRGHTFRWVTDAVCHTAELSLQLCVSVNLIFMEGGIRGGSLCNGSCCLLRPEVGRPGSFVDSSWPCFCLTLSLPKRAPMNGAIFN